jgi:hypothetical protein
MIAVHKVRGHFFQHEIVLTFWECEKLEHNQATIKLSLKLIVFDVVLNISWLITQLITNDLI